MIKHLETDASQDVEFTALGKNINIRGFSRNDWIFKTISSTKNFYEIDLLQYMKYVLRGKTGVTVDVGSNIGNHSIYFGTFISSKVICFEPNPQVLPVLKRNLLKNMINHRLFELGLGDKEEYAQVEIPKGHESNVGAARLEQTSVSSNAVHVVTLDSLLPTIKEYLQDQDLIALKMDVEGMEPKVLNGGEATISLYKPEIFVEISDSKQLQEIDPILKGLGYEKIVSYAATPVWHYSHRSKLGLMKKLRLQRYILLDKVLKIIKSKASAASGVLR